MKPTITDNTLEGYRCRCETFRNLYNDSHDYAHQLTRQDAQLYMQGWQLERLTKAIIKHTAIMQEIAAAITGKDSENAAAVPDHAEND